MELDRVASECCFTMAQIESLVIAACCISTGNSPGEDVDKDTVVFDILEVVRRLSSESKDTCWSLQHALLMKRIDPENRCGKTHR